MAWQRSSRSTIQASPVEVDIAKIPLLPPGNWRLVPTEEMQLIGAVPKNYLVYGDINSPDAEGYFAKQGRLGQKASSGPYGRARECVTEEIFSAIGRTLPIRIAKSRLVRLPTPHGQPSDVRFMSRNFVRRGEFVLTHGVELFSSFIGARSAEEMHAVFNLEDKSEERKFYNVDLAIEVLKSIARTPTERADLLASFGAMLGFDALVGAQDRHATNWGVLESVLDRNAPRHFAPIFDTARGLFWHFPDEHLVKNVKTNRLSFLKDYAAKSRPIFGCSEHDAGPDVNHFRLVASLLKRPEPEFVEAVRKVIRHFHIVTVRKALARQFRRLVSPIRLELIGELLELRHNELMAILENRKT